MELSSSSALTIESVRLALGAAGLRQRVISDNIANVNSPEHVRMRVVFEEQLAQALASAQGVEDPAEAVSLLQASVPTLEADPVQGKVELDEEMAALSSNSLRYHALTRGLSRYLSIASMIASSTR